MEAISIDFTRANVLSRALESEKFMGNFFWALNSKRNDEVISVVFLYAPGLCAD